MLSLAINALIDEFTRLDALNYEFIVYKQQVICWHVFRLKIVWATVQNVFNIVLTMLKLTFDF